MFPSIALIEVMLATVWVSDGSTCKYKTRHFANTPTDGWNEYLPLEAEHAALPTPHGLGGVEEEGIKIKHSWYSLYAIC